MDELVRLVSDKVGLPVAISRKAVDTVLEYLRSNLSQQAISPVDSLLHGCKTGSICEHNTIRAVSIKLQGKPRI